MHWVDDAYLIIYLEALVLIDPIIFSILRFLVTKANRIKTLKVPKKISLKILAASDQERRCLLDPLGDLTIKSDFFPIHEFSSILERASYRMGLNIAKNHG